MSYVIDANVLIGASISGKAGYRTAFGALNLIVPDFALVEIEKYKDTIIATSKLNDAELRRFTFDIFQRFTVLPNYFLTSNALAEAKRLIADVDPKDISYVALAIQTESILLTRDRSIYVAARQKGFRRIILFDDFLRSYL